MAHLAVLFLGSVAFPGPPGSLSAQSSDPGDPMYLLIHVDGVSSQVFRSELEGGGLPNFARIFSDKQIIPYGVSFFPPFTATVVKRVREARATDEGRAIDWAEFDRDTEVALGRAGVFGLYFRTVPRQARSNFLHGLPYMDPLGGLAMWNVPEMIERYGVMEYYWFGTDTAGHLWGEEALRASLRRFDHYLPRLMDRIPDEANVVIYSDHGMHFGEVRDYDREVKELLGDRATYFAYPNVFLKEPDERAEVAEEIVRSTAQDFAFYRADDARIVGLAASGSFAFVRRGDRIRYEPGDADPLGYRKVGYRGEWLEADEWLELTHALEHPYTPVRIVQLFDNPRTGDVVVSLNDGKPKAGPWVRAGNHHGITSTDMTVPVLVRGPDLEHLYGREHVRLEDLLAHLPLANLVPRPPARERHTASLWIRDVQLPSMGGEVTVSPRYRTRVGTELTFTRNDGSEDVRVWAMFDLTSGFLSRFWAGGGVVSREETSLLAMAWYELRIRHVGLRVRFSNVEPTRLDLFYRPHEQLEVRSRGLADLGLGIRF